MPVWLCPRAGQCMHGVRGRGGCGGLSGGGPGADGYPRGQRPQAPRQRNTAGGSPHGLLSPVSPCLGAAHDVHSPIDLVIIHMAALIGRVASGCLARHFSVLPACLTRNKCDELATGATVAGEFADGFKA